MARIVIEHLRGNALRLTILVVCLLAVAPALTSAGPLPSLPTQNLPPQVQQPVNQAQNTVNNTAGQAGNTVNRLTSPSSGGSGGTGGNSGGLIECRQALAQVAQDALRLDRTSLLRIQ